MSINLANLQPNKVSRKLEQYSMCLIGATGDGKTTSMMKMLESLTEEDGRKPLFLMFEDRYASIPGIMAQRIHSIPELMMVVGQLKNPKIKELYSSIVIDTGQKFEKMLTQYVCNNNNAEIIRDIGKFGKGTQYFRSALYILDEIKNLGFPLHYICQASIRNEEGEDIYELRMNDKNTLAIIKEDSNMTGLVQKMKVDPSDPNSEEDWFLTFKKCEKFPDLKDAFGMPQKLKVSEFKDELNKALDKIDEGSLTDEKTITQYEEKDDFKDIIERCKNLGNTLVGEGLANDVLAILSTKIGVDDDGNPLKFDSIIESQIDLAKVVLMSLEDLAEKHDVTVE